MSTFITTLPVDLKPLLNSLPKGASVHFLKWNAEASRLECVWEDETLKTGFTFALPFDLADLNARKLPRGVKVVAGAAPANSPTCTSAPATYASAESAPPAAAPGNTPPQVPPAQPPRPLTKAERKALAKAQARQSGR